MNRYGFSDECRFVDQANGGVFRQMTCEEGHEV